MERKNKKILCLGVAVFVLLAGLLYAVYRNHVSLREAILRGDVELVRKNLQKGRDVNEPVQGGTYLTLTFIAARGPRGITLTADQVASRKRTIYEMVKLLVENGADTNVYSKQYRGKTPLHLSIRLDMKHVAAFLLENGASVEMVDNKYRTPLMLAAGFGRGGYTGMLLERGAQKTINYQDIEGNTALHHAIIAHGDRKLVKLLLEHGVDPLVKNDDGQTALALPRAVDDVALLALLEWYVSKAPARTETPE